MDTRDGRIYTDEEMKEMAKTLFRPGEQEEYFKMIVPTETQLKRVPPRVGRNEKCPCGSGKKFKKCCLIK